MPNEPLTAEEGVSKKEFSIARKGYDPAEVDAHLTECDAAFRELEEYAVRLKHELGEAKAEIVRLRAAEQEAVDQAMRAVFDAKERILKQARLKASEIEKRASGEPAVAVPQADGGSPAPQASPLIDTSSSEPSTPTSSASTPDEVLQSMVREADTIRTQLKRGLSTAFDQMDRMQRDAEQRAKALLDEARLAADQLRSGGDEGRPHAPSGGKATFEVLLDTTAEKENGDRPSRYSKNSARLPRIGESEGESVLASMNELRNRFRETEQTDEVEEPIG